MNAFDISPVTAWSQMQAGQLQLIDVRSPQEQRAGCIAQARTSALAELPSAIDPAKPCAILCARGISAAEAVLSLRQAGHRNVFNLAGGFVAWQAAALPIVDADHCFERYQRQMSLPEVGEAGQAKLNNATVALIGVGGLGCPAALYLAAAGVGQLILIDPDRVERSNLHRQVLHDEAAVGTLKVDSAQARLLALNPNLKLRRHAVALSATNAAELLAGADVVIDGSDNLASRDASHVYAVQADLPWVYAAVDQWQGQLAIFHVNEAPDAGCYHCLFPPVTGAAPPRTCAEAGVMGVAPAILGSLQATQAIHCILGQHRGLVGQLWRIDLLTMQWHTTHLHRDPQCPVCAPKGSRKNTSESAHQRATIT